MAERHVADDAPWHRTCHTTHQHRGARTGLCSPLDRRDQRLNPFFRPVFARLCRSHKTFTCRRKFEDRHRVMPVLHDLSPRPPTDGRSGPLATSTDRSELDQAEGHGGAETRGDPGIKADRPGSLIERTGGFRPRRTGDRIKAQGTLQRLRPEKTGGNRIGIDGRRGARPRGTPETRSATGYS